MIDGPLITRYKSKIGNETLIFNPSVAFVIRGRGSYASDKSAWITQNVFYRFITSMTSVYQGLNTSELYKQEGTALYLDKKKASKVARRISLYRNTLTIVPCVIPIGDAQFARGIELLADTNSIGVIMHTDVLSLLEQLEHFDATTFSLLAGLVDEVESMNTRLDLINMKLDQILELLKTIQIPAPPKTESILHWDQLPL